MKALRDFPSKSAKSHPTSIILYFTHLVGVWVDATDAKVWIRNGGGLWGAADNLIPSFLHIREKKYEIEIEIKNKYKNIENFIRTIIVNDEFIRYKLDMVALCAMLETSYQNFSGWER